MGRALQDQAFFFSRTKRHHHPSAHPGTGKNWRESTISPSFSDRKAPVGTYTQQELFGPYLLRLYFLFLKMPKSVKWFGRSMTVFLLSLSLETYSTDNGFTTFMTIFFLSLSLETYGQWLFKTFNYCTITSSTRTCK
jgi:hypothetical protein